MMEVNRRGTATEYKNGHHYLTYVQWEDGHCEIEIHKCVPELLFHSCDQHELKEAEEIFKGLQIEERGIKELEGGSHKTMMDIGCK